MDGGLFRQEVTDSKRRNSIGAIHLAIPTSGWLFSIVALGFALLLVVYACTGKYTRRVKVTGTLMPAAGLISVRAKSQGEVIRALVHQGENVKQGQALLEFDDSVESIAMGDAQAIAAHQLTVQQRGYQADLNVNSALSDSQKRALRERISALRAQQVQIGEQLTIQRNEADSQERRYKTMGPLLEKGYISGYEGDQYRATVLNSQLQVKQLLRQQLDLRQQLTDAEQQLAQIPLNLVTRQNDVKSRLADIERSLAQNEQQRAWVLRSPRAATVSTLLIKPGQVALAGRPLLTLLPEGSRLEAQLLVPSSAIGFVAVGQRVVVRYQAFPYQKFGQQFGTVKEISSSALSVDEFEVLGLKATEPAYRISVALDKQQISSGLQERNLRPGMELEADILQERRRLIEWVFEPLIGLSRKIFESPNKLGPKNG